jgi:membrane fusion protein (multidrug efflux system)
MKFLGPGLRLLLALCLLLPVGLGVACNRSDDAGGGDDTEAVDGSSDSSKDEDSKKRKKKKAKDGEDDEDDEDQAVPVEVVALERGRIEAVLRFSTNLEAENEVQVLSEAARKVTRLLVEEGDDVKKGQLLVSLQDEAQRTEVARVESQLGKARREYERQTNLWEQKLISEETYTEATYNLDQLELALRDAKRELGYAEVRAPIKGTLTERFVNVGDYVTVNQHLFDIVDFDSIVARVYVPEKELHRLKPGQNARLFAEAAGAEARTGTVDRLAPRVDPKSGTVKVTVAIPRSENLLPGMYVTAEIITEVHEDAVLVPKKALVYDADQIFVFRMKNDDTVERLLIEAALQDRDNIEPAALLAAGDRLVVGGQSSLKDGSIVRLVGIERPEDSESEEKEAK